MWFECLRNVDIIETEREKEPERVNETETSAWESEREWESEEESKSRANEFLASVCVFLFFLTLDFLLFCKSGIKKEKNSLNFFLNWLFECSTQKLEDSILKTWKDSKTWKKCKVAFLAKKVSRQQRCKNIFHQVCQNFCCILMNFEKSWLDEKKKKKKIRTFWWKKNCCPWYENFFKSISSKLNNFELFFIKARIPSVVLFGFSFLLKKVKQKSFWPKKPIMRSERAYN